MIDTTLLLDDVRFAKALLEKDLLSGSDMVFAPRNFEDEGCNLRLLFTCHCVSCSFSFKKGEKLSFQKLSDQ